MRADDKERYGQRVVDHFSSLPHRPYEEAETLEDLRPVLNVVRTLLKLGHFHQAANAYQAELSNALLYNVGAYAETLSLLRPFFPEDWGQLPSLVDAPKAADMANSAANALLSSGESKRALAAYGAALESILQRGAWNVAGSRLRNIARSLRSQGLIAKATRITGLALDLANVRNDEEDLFMGRLLLFTLQVDIGDWAEAEATWQLLNPMGRKWSRSSYRPGDAEDDYARFQYQRGTLREAHLMAAERLARAGKNRIAIGYLLILRGRWQLDRGEWTLAGLSFGEAVRMARESGTSDAVSETGLAIAKNKLSQLDEPHREAERLSQQRYVSNRLLAQLWLDLGNSEKAKHHALAAYEWAWADGEPYVDRHELTKAAEILKEMEVPIPKLPPYDPAKDDPFAWEDDVRAAIEKFRADKDAKSQGEGTAEN
jgi:tetratricopeptide (TPR) repeat protein